MFLNRLHFIKIIPDKKKKGGKKQSFKTVGGVKVAEGKETKSNYSTSEKLNRVYAQLISVLQISTLNKRRKEEN
jgi:hypothetical protein